MREGGSYTKNPVTGELTLTQRTLDEQPDAPATIADAIADMPPEKLSESIVSPAENPMPGKARKTKE